MLTIRTGRGLKLAFAAFMISTAFPVSAPAVAADDAGTACAEPGAFVFPKVGGGVLTPLKSYTVARRATLDGGFVLAIQSSGDAAFALKDAATGAALASGTVTADTPAVVFTTPSPYASLCLVVTNTDSAPIQFAYVLERLS